MVSSRWSAIFSRTAFATPDKKSRSLIRKNHELSVRRQCELFRVTRFAVYTEPKAPDPKVAGLKESLIKKIDEIHTEHPALGQRKILKRLRNECYTVGRKLVRRLMQEMGLHTVYPKINLSKRNFKEAIVPYLLRNVTVQFSNQVWSIDITYIRMEHSHMYLVAVIDWFSRKIMGWDLSDTLDTNFVIKAVRNTVDVYGTPGILKLNI